MRSKVAGGQCRLVWRRKPLQASRTPPAPQATPCRQRPPATHAPHAFSTTSHRRWQGRAETVARGYAQLRGSGTAAGACYCKSTPSPPSVPSSPFRGSTLPCPPPAAQRARSSPAPPPCSSPSAPRPLPAHHRPRTPPHLSVFLGEWPPRPCRPSRLSGDRVVPHRPRRYGRPHLERLRRVELLLTPM